MKTGASYYPELVEASTWEADLATARSLGLSVLRCGEFAWSRLLPEPGRWDSAWAAAFLDAAHRHGFGVVWCTPSASPPPELFDRWPELAAVNQDGHLMPAGVRRAYCPSHPGYRELCADLAARLARDLGGHAAVVGWQVDNELAGDGFTCWCPRCGEAFQEWLERRYGTVDALNRAWQTGVWSQRYARWTQVPVPHRAFAAPHAPSLKLAWRRFRSDNWLAFYRAQAEALRAAGVPQPVTTNFYDLSWDVPFDQWAWRPHLDAMGQSLYVEDETAVRFELALLRGLDDRAVWVLEQKAGQQNAQNLYPEPLGRIGRHLRLCAEGGAGMGIYWHLRQHRSGCEMEHGAVVRHDGRPTRVARAIAAAAPNLPPPAPRHEGPVLVFDFAQHWAQENRPQSGTPWDYRSTLEQDWFGAARDVWGACRVGPFGAALAGGGTVLLPHFQMIDDAQAGALAAFVRRGGSLVVTADAGRLDTENNVRPLAPLEAWRGLGEIPAGEWLHLRPDFAVEGEWRGQPLKGRRFWLVPDLPPPPEGGLRHEEFAGPPFLEFRAGKGRLIILLSAFDRESLVLLLRSLAL